MNDWLQFLNKYDNFNDFYKNIGMYKNSDDSDEENVDWGELYEEDKNNEYKKELEDCENEKNQDYKKLFEESNCILSESEKELIEKKIRLKNKPITKEIISKPFDTFKTKNINVETFLNIIEKNIKKFEQKYNVERKHVEILKSSFTEYYFKCYVEESNDDYEIRIQQLIYKELYIQNDKKIKIRDKKIKVLKETLDYFGDDIYKIFEQIQTKK